MSANSVPKEINLVYLVNNPVFVFVIFERDLQHNADYVMVYCQSQNTYQLIFSSVEYAILAHTVATWQEVRQVADIYCINGRRKNEVLYILWQGTE